MHYMTRRKEPAMRDLDREALIAELQRLKPQFERRGVSHLALFGSRARQDNRPDSDVDLVLDLDEAADDKFSLLDLAGLYGLIEDELGLESSLLMRRSLNDNFKWTVQRDQVVVF
jgi:predicted nucleotidyltransferase